MKNMCHARSEKHTTTCIHSFHVFSKINILVNITEFYGVPSYSRYKYDMLKTNIPSRPAYATILLSKIKDPLIYY